MNTFHTLLQGATTTAECGVFVPPQLPGTTQSLTWGYFWFLLFSIYFSHITQILCGKLHIQTPVLRNPPFSQTVTANLATFIVLWLTKLTIISPTAISPFDYLRLVEFDQRLEDLDKKIKTFKKKEVMNMDELKKNVETLTQITANLETALIELEVKVTDLKALILKKNMDLTSSWKSWKCSHCCHFYRISTKRRLCWRRAKVSSQYSKLW